MTSKEKLIAFCVLRPIVETLFADDGEETAHEQA